MKTLMNILLLGHTGLLGQALFNELKQKFNVYGCSKSECDITDSESIRKIFSKTKPDVVINATGYTDVDKAEKEKQKAFSVNETGVKNISDIIKPSGAVLLHFSTDYVFNGNNAKGYKEDDKPSPISAYGESKAAGEQIILKNLKNYYLIRTAWLYGSGGKNFVDTMLKLARENDTLKVVNDQIGNPTYTCDLAKIIGSLLEKKPIYGIYHLVANGSCSWYEFACEIFNQLGVPKQIIPITSNELDRPAKRPKCSMLINTKFDKLRHWKEALSDFLKAKTLIL